MGEPAEYSLPSRLFLGKLKRNMISQTLQRKRELAKAKRRASVASVLPMRMTSCIFRKPVTRISSHPGNQVRRRPWEEKLEKPQQLSALSRLQELQGHGSEGELLSPLGFADVLKIIALGRQGESLVPAGPEDLHTRPEVNPGKAPYCRGMIPGELHCSPPFYSQQVTSADIRRQTWKVKKARKRLADALKADRLAWEAESMRSQDEQSENYVMNRKHC